MALLLAAVPAIAIAQAPAGPSTGIIVFPRATHRSIETASLEAQLRRMGVDLAATVAAAVKGDTAELQSLLQIPMTVALDSSTMALPFIIAGLLQSVGDTSFAAALVAIEPGAAGKAWQLVRIALDQADLVPFPLSRAYGDSLPRQFLSPPRGVLAITDREIDDPPRVIPGTCQTPVFPESLRAANMSVKAVLTFVIDSSGAVDRETVIIQATTHDAFARAARASIATCRFAPARAGGRPVSVMAQQPFNFRLTP